MIQVSVSREGETNSFDRYSGEAAPRVGEYIAIVELESLIIYKVIKVIHLVRRRPDINHLSEVQVIVKQGEL